jgi:nucleoprotein TPR
MEMETQAKLGDSEVVPLRYQVQRLQSELDTTTAHSKWLENELQARNEQLAEVKASQASQIAKLRSSLDATNEQKESALSELEILRRQNQELTSKNEAMSKELHDTRNELSVSIQNGEEDLIAERRLVSLQKEQIERLEQKHNSIGAENERLRTLAREAEEDSRRELAQIKQENKANTKKLLEQQDAEHKEELEELKKQLKDEERRRVEVEEGFLLTSSSSPARVRTRSSRTGRSPYMLRNRAERDDEDNEGGDDEEPMNLTELHSRLAEAQDDLQVERTKRKRAEIQIRRIESEIQDNASILKRQRHEYEVALERQEEYKKRLDSSLQEAQVARNEASELKNQLTRLTQRNAELEGESIELAQQVQALLVSRSGGSGDSNIPTSVVEMQSQNQRLLGELRQSKARIAELENSSNEDNLRRKLDSLEKDLANMREERQRQSVMVESLVQQRDLYRAIVVKENKNLLGSSAEETSAIALVQQQSERTKALEERNSKLENTVLSAQEEVSKALREKEMISERLARYETLNSELTSSLDRLQIQLSEAKADIARSQAEASFHKDKASRTEESLQRSREEVARISKSKLDLQRVNGELEKAQSVAESQATKFESDLKQAQMKLRLAETQCETAKAAEQRMASEANQLRLELAKQGALLESVQRIEAGLSAKAAAEHETMKDQLTQLTEQRSKDETRHSAEIEKLNAKLEQSQAQATELASSRENAAKEALESKKELLKASQELKAAKQKIDTLEAQLRTAKRKLGESGDDEDAEAQLQNRINTLTAELEEAREEAKRLKVQATEQRKLASEREKSLSELTKASEELKKAHQKEVSDLKEQYEIVRIESSKKQEIITELTNDLAGHRGEKDKAVAELQNKIESLKSETENYKKDANAAVERYSTLETEVTSLRTEVSTAQVSILTSSYHRSFAFSPH